MKIICPICGEPGYLTEEIRKNHKYLYVIHFVKEGDKRKKRKHYLGKDLSYIKNEIEQIIKNKSRKIIQYAGGDYFIADVLLERLNKLCIYKNCTFVEVFGGSGYISQIIDRKKFTNIIYNDIDDKLTALYKTIKENPEKLALYLSLLPCSRSFNKLMSDLLLNKNENLAAFETAAMLFYVLNTSFQGGIKKGFAVSKNPNRSLSKSFFGHVRGILDFANNWKDIVIENLDFRKVIKIYDGEKTVFYLDPPYPNKDNYYENSFTVKDLREMAEMLTKIKGKFLLKLDEQTYEYIKDILTEDKFKVEKLERTLMMHKKKLEKRDKWILTLISN